MCWYSEVGTETRLWVEQPRNRISIFSPRIRLWVSRAHLYDIWIPLSILFNELQGSTHPPSATPHPTQPNVILPLISHLASMSWKRELHFTVLHAFLRYTANILLWMQLLLSAITTNFLWVMTAKFTHGLITIPIRYETQKPDTCVPFPLPMTKHFLLPNT